MSIVDDYEYLYANLSYYSHFFIPTPKTVREPLTPGEESKLPRLIRSNKFPNVYASFAYFTEFWEHKNND